MEKSDNGLFHPLYLLAVAVRLTITANLYPLLYPLLYCDWYKSRREFTGRAPWFLRSEVASTERVAMVATATKRWDTAIINLIFQFDKLLNDRIGSCSWCVRLFFGVNARAREGKRETSRDENILRHIRSRKPKILILPWRYARCHGHNTAVKLLFAHLERSSESNDIF